MHPAKRAAPASATLAEDFDSPPPSRPLPAGWVRTVDSWAGYSVAHPPQWNVHCENGVITVSQDRSGTVQAFVWPIQLRVPLHAQQVAQEFHTWALAQNPHFEAWMGPTLQVFPRHVTMRTRSRVAGQCVEGVITITVCGSNALINGFHGLLASEGPAGVVREVQTLMDVAGSFQVEQPIPRLRFREPGEGSFEVMVPGGWQPSGRTRRSIWSTTAACDFSALKDSAGSTKVAVPSDLWHFADGPIMGLLTLGLMGMRPFVPAEKCGPDLVTRRFKDQTHRRILEVTECPHMFPLLYSELARMGLAPDLAEISTTCVVSQHLHGGVRIRQKSFIGTARPRGTARWNSMFSGLWIAELMAYYHAPESEFDAMEPILAGVIDSFKINSDWVQRERAAAMEMAMILGNMLQQQVRQQQAQQQQALQQAQTMQHQMAQRRADITHTLQQSSDIIMHGWQERNKIYDHINHQWSNVTLGRSDVLDPSYGTIYSVPSGSDQYFRTNSGTIIGAPLSTRPDPSWHKLDPINI